MRHLNFRKQSYYPAQWDFLRCNARNKALVTGYGYGKTHIFLRDMLNSHVTRLNSKGKSNGGIIYPTLALAEELFVEGFDELLFNQGIRRNYHASKMRFKTDCGIIKLWSLEKAAKIVGSEWTFCGIDEFDVGSVKNCDIAYTKATGRGRGCKDFQISVVTTPEGYKSTYRIFVTNKDEGDKALFRGKSTDNPNLDHAYIQDMRNTYDDKLVEQYINGEFVNINGQAAYYSFDRKRDVIPTTRLDPELIMVGMDFNVDPMSAVLGTMINGVLVIYKEIFLRNSNTKAMCQHLSSMYPKKIIEVSPDMTGVTRSTVGGLGVTDLGIISDDFGFTLRGTRGLGVRDRLNTVNGAFDNERIKIMDCCENLIKDCEQVVTTEKGDIEKSNSNKLLTHLSDGMSYLVCARLPLAKHKRAIIR